MICNSLYINTNYFLKFNLYAPYWVLLECRIMVKNIRPPEWSSIPTKQNRCWP